MTAMVPIMLSVAMLAVIALAIGGIVLIVREKDRRRGTLMLIAALVILGNVLIWTI